MAEISAVPSIHYFIAAAVSALILRVTSMSSWLTVIDVDIMLTTYILGDHDYIECGESDPDCVSSTTSRAYQPSISTGWATICTDKARFAEGWNSRPGLLSASRGSVDFRRSQHDVFRCSFSDIRLAAIFRRKVRDRARPGGDSGDGIAAQWNSDFTGVRCFRWIAIGVDIRRRAQRHSPTSINWYFHGHHACGAILRIGVRSSAFYTKYFR